MLRVRITKKAKGHKVGDVVFVDNNEAFGLIDSGKAILTKDLTPDDYKVAQAEQAGVSNGKPSKLRPNLGK